MAKPYAVLNEVQSDIATGNTWTRGTDASIVLTDASDFDAGGGYIRIGTSLSFALMEYTGITTNTLTGLAVCTLGVVVSTGDETKEWPAGDAVQRTFMAEDANELGDIATDAIWDAAGDLVQGTGANTAARLAKGAALALPRMNAGGTAVEWGGSGQIAFPATANPSADANTLDDYEEGTWTPVVQGADTAGTYEITVYDATYTKIGSSVFITCDLIREASITGGGVGYLQVTGLPFTCANANSLVGMAFTVNSALIKDYIMVGITGAATYALLVSLGVDGTSTVMDVDDFDSGGYIRFNVMYRI